MHWKGTTALGVYGERYLAPKLLECIGLQQLVDLNQRKPNFPWADFCGKKEGQWWMVNVKTRSKRTNYGELNGSYNTSNGLKSYNKAIAELKRLNLPACEPMWLAIAMEIDQTYEAYWGEGKEMRNFKNSEKPNISWGIRMSEEYTTKYRNENRMVADKERHNFDWLLYPDNWTYEAHLNWRKKQGLG